MSSSSRSSICFSSIGIFLSPIPSTPPMETESSARPHSVDSLQHFRPRSPLRAMRRRVRVLARVVLDPSCPQTRPASRPPIDSWCGSRRQPRVRLRSAVLAGARPGGAASRRASRTWPGDAVSPSPVSGAAPSASARAREAGNSVSWWSSAPSILPGTTRASPICSPKRLSSIRSFSCPLWITKEGRSGRDCMACGGALDGWRYPR